MKFVVETLRFAAAGDQQSALLRGAVHAAEMLALAGHADVFATMIETAVAANEAPREAITLGIGGVMLRQPLVALDAFRVGRHRDRWPRCSGTPLTSCRRISKKSALAPRCAGRRAAPEGLARRQAAASLLDALEY